MKVQVLPSAVGDLEEGRHFYEQQGGRPLGEDFFETIFSEIDVLSQIAGVHAQFEGYFRLLSKRFPYAIFYKVDEDVVIVWRVLDLRQDPRKIRGKL